MTTEIANLDMMRKARQNMEKSIGQPAGAFGGKELLKMEKGSGEWVYGQDAEPLDGAKIAINPASFQHGLIAWQAGAVAGEKMVPSHMDAPSRADMANPDLRWDNQVAFCAAIVDGPAAGTQLLYKTTAVGGKEFVGKLFDDILDQLYHEPEQPIAVIELSNSHYVHKEWGKIFKPEYTVAQWVENLPEQAEEPDVTMVEADVVVEAPTPRRRRARK